MNTILLVLLGAAMLCIGVLRLVPITENHEKLKDQPSMSQRFKCEVEQIPADAAGLVRSYAVECQPVEIIRKI